MTLTIRPATATVLDPAVDEGQLGDRPIFGPQRAQVQFEGAAPGTPQSCIDQIAQARPPGKRQIQREHQEQEEEEGHHDGQRKLRRAHDELGWAPRVGVEDGLRRLHAWVGDNLDAMPSPSA